MVVDITNNTRVCLSFDVIPGTCLEAKASDMIAQFLELISIKPREKNICSKRKEG